MNFEHFRITVALYFRNRMALLYGYLFPAMFLLAFWVLYRYERVPLVRHMGELLTIAVLGGACFGLPTSIVGERERGVWRRYRLAPVSSGRLVLGTIAARYVILLTAGLLQLALAMSLGMPPPTHTFGLWLAFTIVAFAFIGLGLVIAMTADNVPAVQALGQCIFLPMLIIGGIAVPLTSLPDWALHVSAFFPGRYAVELLQACVSGDGLDTALFAIAALLVIGAAGCVAGAKMFRWDAQQRFAAVPGAKGWIAAALAAWVAVGVLAESRGQVAPPARTSAGQSPTVSRADTNLPASGLNPQPLQSVTPPRPASPVVKPEERLEAERPAPAPPAAQPSAKPGARNLPTPVQPAPSGGRAPVPEPAPVPPLAAPTPSAPPARQDPVVPGASAKWQAVTLAEIDREIVFDRLPPDDGVVTPIAPIDEEPDPNLAPELDAMRDMLPRWAPGQVEDSVQRARNYLYVAGVADVFQLPTERHIPHLIFDRLQADIPREQLPKVLYWIALHPSEGDDSAVDQMRPLGLGNGPSDIEETRQRVALYAVKLLGRLTGKIK